MKLIADANRPSQAAILDFLDTEHDSEKEMEEESSMSSSVKESGLQPRPSKSQLWQPVPWEPPEAWECTKGPKDVPATFKTRGLGLPFQPLSPRRGGGREMRDEMAWDE